MEEKDLTQKLYDIFEATMPALENITNGFLTQNQTMLQQGEAQFVEILSSNLSFAEKIITENQKSEADKRFLSLLVPLQKIASAVRSLMAKQEMILRRDITFSVMAITEITELLTVMKRQFRDTRDLILTKNPSLKEIVKSETERIIKRADTFLLAHQERLIAGACATKASYLYLDIIGSIKAVAQELVSFAERI
jgi:Na+/phosphate symporter